MTATLDALFLHFKEAILGIEDPVKDRVMRLFLCYCFFDVKKFTQQNRSIHSGPYSIINSER